MDLSGAALTLSQWSGFSFGNGAPFLPINGVYWGSWGGAFGGLRCPFINGGGNGGGGTPTGGFGGGGGGGGGDESCFGVWFDPEEESEFLGDDVTKTGNVVDLEALNLNWVEEEVEEYEGETCTRGGGRGGGGGGVKPISDLGKYRLFCTFWLCFCGILGENGDKFEMGVDEISKFIGEFTEQGWKKISELSLTLQDECESYKEWKDSSSCDCSSTGMILSPDWEINPSDSYLIDSSISWTHLISPEPEQLA